MQPTRIVLESSCNERSPVRFGIPELDVWLDLSVSEAIDFTVDDEMPASFVKASARSSGCVDKHLIERWEERGWGLAFDVEMFRSSPVSGTVTSVSPEPGIHAEDPDDPGLRRSRPLVETLLNRRSLYEYRLDSAPADDFEQIVKGSRVAVVGMPDIRTRSGLHVDDLRLRRFVAVYSVEGYSSGVYEEKESDGELQLSLSVSEDDLRSSMRTGMCDQSSVLAANWTVLWVVNSERLLGQAVGACSALTDLYLLSGVWCQEYLLHAENLRYGSVITSAVRDNALSELLGFGSSFDMVVHTATTGRRQLL
ncbi:MAG: hypothetical protein OXI96_00765 [Acidimicrobiaceae bacterium]|nr:hypothetical protein [Acidimicrobiaceae bacterium]